MSHSMLRWQVMDAGVQDKLKLNSQSLVEDHKGHKWEGLDETKKKISLLPIL